MGRATFNYIKNLMMPDIKDQHTRFGRSLTAGQRLAMFLYYVASGASHTSIVRAVRDVSKAICAKMGSFIQFPRSMVELDRSAVAFRL